MLKLSLIHILREDLFTHIESLSHEQLNEIPVGKLVTRVTNDTNAISMMFTNLLVSLTKNAFVIVGILIAMICLNYELTLMVLCFVPFIVIFTVIFRKISIDIRRRILYPAVCPAGKLPEDHCKDHNEGNKAQHHQRQLII